MFLFTVSSGTAILNPNGTVSVTLTQTSTAPQSVTYGVSTKYVGGWDSPAYLDEHQQVTCAFSPTPAILTGNGTLTLTFAATSSVAAQTLVVTIYGLQQLTGDPNSTVNQAKTVTLMIT